MRLSQLFTKTSKQSQSDASSINADLLTRAGFIHKTMAGVYSFLPLGNRVLQKVEAIVREEMDLLGREVFLSALAPVDAWQKTGRYDTIDVLLAAQPANAASKKINDATYVLSSTHEEIITPIVQTFVQSYQDLPCAAYQIQTKFRNEPRPKSGLLRGREFRMKDLYSFHADEEDMLRFFHEEATPAYQRVFERLGIGDRTVMALASGGSFSKEPSREFQTFCDTGEDHIFHVPGTDTYYNREIAPSRAPAWGDEAEEERPREDVVGKDIIGVKELADFLKIETERTTKTLLYETDDQQLIAVAVRGGYDVNEHKVMQILGCASLRLASPDTVRRVTGAEVGYAGPIGLPEDVTVLWDDSCRGRKNFECGANVTHQHSINVNFGRDVPEPAQWHDVKVAREGDSDPASDTVYEVSRAVEVGNIFTLYTKFSDAFDFSYRDKEDKDKPVYMGCYGLGTTRVLGVIAEMCNDERGLVWPASVAPARVHIVPIAKREEEEAFVEALRVYKELEAQGTQCLFDDRLSLSVGAKLADADLIGVPLRVVVSPKTLEKGGVEVKERSSSEARIIPVADLFAAVQKSSVR